MSISQQRINALVAVAATATTEWLVLTYTQARAELHKIEEALPWADSQESFEDAHEFCSTRVRIVGAELSRRMLEQAIVVRGIERALGRVFGTPQCKRMGWV